MAEEEEKFVPSVPQPQLAYQPLAQQPAYSLKAEGGDVASDSESVEDSLMSQGGEENFNAREESVYDEEAQWREERMQLVQIFEKRQQRTSCVSGSKVKLPYEMLINKLVDNLETPDLIKHKELPTPFSMKNTPPMFADLKTEKQATPKASVNNDIFAMLYARQATAATSVSETQLPMPME